MDLYLNFELTPLPKYIEEFREQNKDKEKCGKGLRCMKTFREQ